MHATQGVDVQNLIKIHLAVAGLRMREKTGLGAFLLTCLSFYPVLELPGGRGGFPPHCGCQSPLPPATFGVAVPLARRLRGGSRRIL